VLLLILEERHPPADPDIPPHLETILQYILILCQVHTNLGETVYMVPALSQRALNAKSRTYTYTNTLRPSSDFSPEVTTRTEPYGRDQERGSGSSSPYKILL
jgi:hypothetical protein